MWDMQRDWKIVWNDKPRNWILTEERDILKTEEGKLKMTCTEERNQWMKDWKIRSKLNKQRNYGI